MREVIRPLALRDLKVIRKLTGMDDLRYEDIVFAKRLVRDTLMSRDPQNIQMLKCFTLENVLQGLCMLVKRVMPTDLTKLDKSEFTVETIVLDQKTGEQLHKSDGVFDFDKISVPDAVVLFQL
jgi:hypothetical protein